MFCRIYAKKVYWGLQVTGVKMEASSKLKATNANQRVRLLKKKKLYKIRLFLTLRDKTVHPLNIK
jgi:hypothetical protein